MTDYGRQWSEAEWRTLRLSGVWILSALVGRTRFDADERNAFWDCVTDCALKTDGLGRRVLEAMAAERKGLFDEFYLDGRPTVSGLIAVVSLLDRADPEDADRSRAMLLDLGHAFARARGPFGRRISAEDEQTLLIVEQLLLTDSETRQHNPLNSDLPI